ncbi:MAG: hypothetical protein U0132_00470 [Gemmatimonadaceae bacterium]
MDIYLFFLVLGGVGLGAMALSGVAHAATHGGHGSDAHGGGGHGHAGNHITGHGGHANGPTIGGRAGALTGAHVLSHTPADTGGDQDAGDADGDSSSGALRTALAVISPRILFSIVLGLGASGIVLRPLLPGVVLPFAALAAGLVFERAVVNPIWKFAFRFASRPAETLEHAITQQATAVTAFDKSGHGLVAVEVDGQVVQLLATLRKTDLELGVRVRSGDLVRIEDVDAERNRCTVSRT